MQRGGLAEHLNDFNPRPPRGGRQNREAVTGTRSLFQSTPSARRATWLIAYLGGVGIISIHALREEGDQALHHHPL